MTAQLLDSWALSKRAAGCVQATIDAYMNDAGQLVTHLGGDALALTTATRRDIEAFLAGLLDRGLAPATVSRRYRSLVQLFRWLDEEGELEGDNPMAKVSPTIVPENPPPVIGEDDYAKLLAACAKVRQRPGKPAYRPDRLTFENKRDTALVMMLWSSGVRPGEVMGLRVGDIDMLAETFTVLGKGRRERTVAMMPKVALAVDRYLRARARHAQAGLPWLWIHDKGRLKATGLRQMLDRRCIDAGIAHINPHRFRHTFAHRAKQRGMSDDALMDVAGWNTQQMLRRYGRSAAAERAREAHRKLFGDD